MQKNYIIMLHKWDVYTLWVQAAVQTSSYVYSITIVGVRQLFQISKAYWVMHLQNRNIFHYCMQFAQLFVTSERSTADWCDVMWWWYANSLSGTIYICWRGAPFSLCPHGNSKRKESFIRTMPSTLQNLKSIAQDLTPKFAVCEASLSSGGLALAPSARALPWNRQQVSNLRCCTDEAHEPLIEKKKDPLFAVMSMCKEKKKAKVLQSTLFELLLELPNLWLCCALIGA